MKYIVEVNEHGKIWYNEKGERHREDGPACEWLNGDKHWYLNGERHREDGPAIENVNGSKSWWLNGKRHRKDGPAIKYVCGHKEWRLNDKLHREDGPAIEYSNGSKEWWLNGEKLSEEEFNSRRAKANTSLDGKEVEIEGCRYVLRMV